MLYVIKWIMSPIFRQPSSDANRKAQSAKFFEAWISIPFWTTGSVLTYYDATLLLCIFRKTECITLIEDNLEDWFSSLALHGIINCALEFNFFNKVVQNDDFTRNKRCLSIGFNSEFRRMCLVSLKWLGTLQNDVM